jgi:hypothetical protein
MFRCLPHSRMNSFLVNKVSLAFIYIYIFFLSHDRIYCGHIIEMNVYIRAYVFGLIN